MSSSEADLEALRAWAAALAAEPGRADLAGRIRAAVDRLAADRARLLAEQQEGVQRLAHLGRLLELGSLAGAIFHEMNQPLLGIKGFAELLQESCQSLGGKAADWAREIRNQVVQLQRLQDQVNGFLRRKAITPAPVEVKEALDESLRLFQQRLQRRGIRVELGLPADLPPVLIDRLHLVQIFTNLVANAVDALEGAPHKLLCVRAEPIQDGSAVRILVGDTGCGLPPEIAARPFEPFLTTKGERGHGLGLFLCRQLARLHGGEVRLLDPGSEPSVALPRTPSAARDLASQGQVAQAVQAGPLGAGRPDEASVATLIEIRLPRAVEDPG
jgi:signal transduction histidine kinase